MAMQYIEDELRRTDDPRNEAFADLIAVIHKSLGKDIPFPIVPTLADRLKINKDPDIQVLASVIAGMGKLAASNPSLSGVEISPKSSEVNARDDNEATLESEWQKQADGLINHGFHRALRLNNEDYINSLPKFDVQAEEYKGRFDIPLLVDPRIIPLRYMISLLGINRGRASSHVDYVFDWGGDEFKSPKTPLHGLML